MSIMIHDINDPWWWWWSMVMIINDDDFWSIMVIIMVNDGDNDNQRFVINIHSMVLCDFVCYLNYLMTFYFKYKTYIIEILCILYCPRKDWKCFNHLISKYDSKSFHRQKYSIKSILYYLGKYWIWVNF